jgi:ribose transport system ATP-binding protein
MSRRIGVAFQELSVIPNLSVAKNLLLGSEPLLGGFIVNEWRLRRQAEAVLEELEFPIGIDVRTPIGQLALAEQQLIEIAKVLSRRPSVAIFDEPTSALSSVAVGWLFAQLVRLAVSGSTVLFISHRLREVYEITDRVVVLRNGKDVLTAAKDEVTEPELVQAMLGQRLELATAARLASVGDEPLLELEGIRLPRGKKPIDLTIRKGEILGIGGLQGQGQRELLRGLAGREALTGTLKLAGQRIRARSPRQAIQHGICFIPEDRQTEGLLRGLSIRENIVVGARKSDTETVLSRSGWLSRRGEALDALRMMYRLGIKAPSPEVLVDTLSGGNQQKVLIARTLAKGPIVLLLADITRGVDVGTKADIFVMLREFAQAGVGIIFHSTDASELVSHCHRVAVLHDHAIQAILEGPSLTEENIARAAIGIEGWELQREKDA